jgi:hypothetical protein
MKSVLPCRRAFRARLHVIASNVPAEQPRAFAGHHRQRHGPGVLERWPARAIEHAPAVVVAIGLNDLDHEPSR